MQDPMSVLCIRQLVVEALLRDPKRFTAGEQPDSASSQCQTATQQAIPSDQPAANLFILSDEIDPSRARRHQPEPLFGISNSVSVSQATAGIITIAKPGSAKIPSRSGRTNGGARRDRTDDIVLAKHALSQLSYGPLLEKTTCAPLPKPSGLTADRPGAWRMVGLGRLELPTSRLSSARSNQLSYKPLNDQFPRKGSGHACAHRLTPDARTCAAPGACSSAKKEKRRRRNPANGAQQS